MFDAMCDSCGTVFDAAETVYDSDSFDCPNCDCTVSADSDCEQV